MRNWIIRKALGDIVCSILDYSILDGNLPESLWFWDMVAEHFTHE